MDYDDTTDGLIDEFVYHEDNAGAPYALFSHADITRWSDWIMEAIELSYDSARARAD